MRRILAAGLIAVLAGCTPPTAQSIIDYPYYADTAALEKAAPLIVRARVDETGEQDRHGLRTTLGTATVTAVAKGDVAPGDTVDIAFYGPAADATPSTDLAGAEWVLLLETFPADPAVLISGTQGAYAVRDGRAVRGGDNPVELSPATLRALGLR
ncbi:hypothetical protein [Spirilliplanes yamanashiensis]|uniref:Lipoprotein n=1 Tax=Spirilliplanes yamanashiensis TaxID=42233 RepID=A0A8J3Y736_9ACTN|nr:hypothetical protein [Spirilliplanes yamanashiensis]MDP9815078.1 hypothetical protein [Spirilliplanes yamanashiensis]GIJ02734.1 hypothetical protein Sya03_20860 [Spirilliplanes yamanashiensis]